jgi:hypothetical protein
MQYAYVSHIIAGRGKSKKPGKEVVEKFRKKVARREFSLSDWEGVGTSVQGGAEAIEAAFTGVGGDGPFALLIGKFDEFGRQFLEERGRVAGGHGAVLLAPEAMADAQALHGAGDRDVKQAALLVEGSLRRYRRGETPGPCNCAW